MLPKEILKSNKMAIYLFVYFILVPFHIQLRDVVLQEGGTTVDRLTEMKTGLEQNTLRFALGRGLVTGVCPEASEQTWSLNMKKAILSSLQNTMPDFRVSHSTTEVSEIICLYCRDLDGSIL